MTKRRKRRILLFIGITSLLLATAVSFLWFYWLGPLRAYVRRGGLYPDCLRAKKEWAKTKRRIRRTGWAHDDFVTVGRYGDKQFAAEMIRRMKPGQDISACSQGHKDTALRMITNQDAGDIVEDWQEWWQVNRDKTQEEWIREGFEQSGLTLHSPLTHKDIRSLLAVIGTTKEDTHPPRFAAQRHLRNNAMRWLRDSDVDPRDFTMSDLAGDEADAVLHGLLLYTRWVAHSPKYYSPGVLSIGRPAGNVNSESDLAVLSLYTERWFVAAVYALIAITFGGGILCLRLATRKLTPRTDVEADGSGG
ncbi:hypothetical protein HQ563_18885 [bacterium]|nr:hypothetical protein [bacterium]